MYVNNGKGVTKSHRFIESTIHTSNQLGPPSPYMGERRHNAKVFSGTSNFTEGNAQKLCASNLGKCKANPGGGDGWMDGKHGVESTCLGLKAHKCGRNHDNSNLKDGHQVCSISQ